MMDILQTTGIPIGIGIAVGIGIGFLKRSVIIIATIAIPALIWLNYGSAPLDESEGLAEIGRAYANVYLWTAGLTAIVSAWSTYILKNYVRRGHK